MEDRYQHSLDGQEVNETDLNSIATTASLADDHVFAELFRLGAGAKGVVAASPTSALVRPSGSADATTVIESFRAFIGPLAATTGQNAYKNARSAVAASSVDLDPQTVVHAAQATNNRWDLIYARVDIDLDGPSVLRFVKTGTTPAAQQSLVTTKQTVVIVGVVAGTPGATPAKPALPADSGSSHYIALAYVLLLAGHTLTSSIPKAQIDEVAPVLQLSRATGAAALRIANGNYTEGGVVLTNETWTPALGRPRGYLPPTMGGKEELVFVLNQNITDGAHTVPLGTTAVIDSSTDWRNRFFKVKVIVRSPSGGSAARVAWGSAGSNWIPSGALQGSPTDAVQGMHDTVAQSFHDDSGAAIGPVLVDLNATAVMGVGARVRIVVDLSTGTLKAVVGAANPAAIFFFWIEATGQFNNAF